MTERDILDVRFGKGVRVWAKFNRGLGVGTMTGESHVSGLAQIRRWTVTFPHSRTKSRTVNIACEASDLEVISKGMNNND